MSVRSAALQIRLADTTGLKRIVMSDLDRAIAALPGLVRDFDVARLKNPTGILGRDRMGAQVIAEGAGYSIVESPYLNDKPALRLNGDSSHLVRVLGGLSGPDLTVVVVGTMAPKVRDDTPTNNRNIFTVYNGTVQLWARLLSSTGNLGFAIGSSGGVSIARASLPASDTASIFAFSRDEAAQLNGISINGGAVTTGADTDTPSLNQDLTINIGNGNTLGTNLAYYGDIARVVVCDVNLQASYPDLWAAFIAAAKAEYGVAA